ncbi:hypothetical protein OROGR_030725 [Orobanche gracilis]
MSGMPKHTGACSGALLANGLFEELTSPSLKMEDGDEIDTLLQQTGGGD